MDVYCAAIALAAACAVIAMSALFILGGTRMTEEERIADDDAQMAAIKAHEEKKRIKAERKAEKKKERKGGRQDE